MTDDDTTPEATLVETVAEHRSSNLAPGESATLTFEPEVPMREATLFASCEPPGARVLVRRVTLGDIPVVAYATTPETLRTGVLVRGDVSRAEPLRVSVENDDSRQVTVSASLVAGEERRG